MSTTMTMATTLIEPRRWPTPAAPAFTAVSAVKQPSADLDYLVTVSVRGALLLLPAAAGNATATAMRRRTQSGAAYRIDLDEGVTCWLDGDQQDGSGEVNWAATQMCIALSGGRFAGPEDAPFVCGPALFTGTSAADPVALSDEQVRRIVDTHADHVDAATGEELDRLAEAAAVEPYLALA